MKTKFLYLFIFCCFFIPSHLCFSEKLDIEIFAKENYISQPVKNINPSTVLYDLSNEMNIEFFQKIISKKNLNEVNDLAQLEDFDNQKLPLISKSMEMLLNQEALSSKIKFNQNLLLLTSHIEVLNEREKTRTIEKWRATFLDRLGDYIRYLSNLKPLWDVGFNSMTTYDTNVNNLPDNETPFNHSDKKDIQIYLGPYATWQPWVNNKRFSSENFSLKMTQALMGHTDYQENNILSFDAEPKYTRNIGGLLEKVHISYKAQYLALSKEPSASGFSNFFHNHRLKLFFDLENSMPMFEWINTSKTKFAFSRSYKFHFEQNRKDNDAYETTAELNQTFTYHDQNPKLLAINLLLKKYKTKASSASNNTTFSYRLFHSHTLPIKLNNRNLSMNENIGFVKRKFHTFLGGDQIERILKYGVGFNLKLNAKLSSSLQWDYSSKINTINTEILDPISNKAKQHRISLGVFYRL